MNQLTPSTRNPQERNFQRYRLWGGGQPGGLVNLLLKFLLAIGARLCVFDPQLVELRTRAGGGPRPLGVPATLCVSGAARACTARVGLYDSARQEPSLGVSRWISPTRGA